MQLNPIALYELESLASLSYLYTFQDGSPSDRKIVKLCEYASRNQVRIPKVLFFTINSVLYLVYVIMKGIRKTKQAYLNELNQLPRFIMSPYSARLQSISKKDATKSSDLGTSHL